jgi:uncharacterized cupredoxin-like copper-binding protein
MTRLGIYFGILALFVSTAPAAAQSGTSSAQAADTTHHVVKHKATKKRTTKKKTRTATAAKKSAAKDTTARDSTARDTSASAAAGQSSYVAWNAATKTATLKLIAGPFVFNGYGGGKAAFVVPPKSTVVMNFVNEDGTPHSAELIEDKDPMPNAGDASIAAFPRAYTNKVVEGLPQFAKDNMRFTAPESGTYRIFCGVPGHGLSGMWIRFKVDPSAKEPSFQHE